MTGGWRMNPDGALGEGRGGPISRAKLSVLGGAGLAGLLLLVTGCPPASRSIAPRDEHEALARVNDNLGAIDRPVQYQALVSFRFRDANGRDRRFIGHEASLLYAPPQCLRFDIRSLAGVVAQFGSDGERYWIWIEPEVRKLWWGRWERLGQPQTTRLIIAPDDLLDALMLRPLYALRAGGLSPVLRTEADDHRLIYMRLGEDGQPSGLREIRLDAREPYQPREVIDRLADGRVEMHAHLSGYARIGPAGPYVARKYVVHWPLDEAEMRLDVRRARFRPELPAEVFAFPSEWEGEIEPIDAGELP